MFNLNELQVGQTVRTVGVSLIYDAVIESIEGDDLYLRDSDGEINIVERDDVVVTDPDHSGRGQLRAP